MVSFCKILNVEIMLEHLVCVPSMRSFASTSKHYSYKVTSLSMFEYINMLCNDVYNWIVLMFMKSHITFSIVVIFE